MRRASWVALVSCLACGNWLTSPHPEVVFTGDFQLAQESDWSGGQACQYVVAMDQTVCSWGRLAISVDSIASSVLGTDVHQGDQLGPIVHRDSVEFAVRFGVGNVCTVFISGNTVKPNGPGVLSADSLRFDGRNLLGDSVRWVYASLQVQRPKSCA
ncbi:MAG TPA: hypothetical protein VFP39_13580 [Gemmatimonadales bacterium]|nr:hypothetical protein [Gemmatimonadales bacterium]